MNNLEDTNEKVIPLYASNGDAEVFLKYPYLYNRLGEWVGWVTPDYEVYSVLGVYVGFFSKDQRILSKRSLFGSKPRLMPPPPPPKFRPPAYTPLAPLFYELMIGTTDVLLEEPERLHTIDSGALKPDLD
ncbi:MAG TPA: hypothetical protein VJZ78_04295 [Anaerolineales bacterium]|nr:hypothetical protein [Anaerolineales bacterium]